MIPHMIFYGITPGLNRKSIKKAAPVGRGFLGPLVDNPSHPKEEKECSQETDNRVDLVKKDIDKNHDNKPEPANSMNAVDDRGTE